MNKIERLKQLLKEHDSLTKEKESLQALVDWIENPPDRVEGLFLGRDSCLYERTNTGHFRTKQLDGLVEHMKAQAVCYIHRALNNIRQDLENIEEQV